VLIVALDFLFWRPLVAWADKFKVEMSTSSAAPRSPVLDLLRSSALVGLCAAEGIPADGAWLAALLDRLQPLGTTEPAAPDRAVVVTAKRLARLLAGLLTLGLVGVGLAKLVGQVAQVDAGTWGELIVAARRHPAPHAYRGGDRCGLDGSRGRGYRHVTGMVTAAGSLWSR